MNDAAIAEDVEAARKRVRAADPDAYSGFVTDAACYAVAERHGIRGVEALRIWRTERGEAERLSYRPGDAFRIPPPGADSVSDEGKAAASAFPSSVAP